MVDEQLKNRIRTAAKARDFTKVDELWAELVAQSAWKEDLNVFTDVANDLNERGERERAGQHLVLLLDAMKKGDASPDRHFELARKAAKFQPKNKMLREELTNHYKRAYGDRTGLEAAFKRSGLTSDAPLDKAVQVLDESFRFAAGDFCAHKKGDPSGWGIGRVVEAHPETGEYVIDFQRRRNQRMAADMARTSVEKRDNDDLDVLLWTDKEKVGKLADEDPLQLLKSALKSAPGGKLQSRDLREKLEGPVLDKNGWTKFWARARKLAKDDPWIEVGAAPKSVITQRAQPLSRDAEVSKTVDKAGPFLKKLETARRELLAIAKDAVAKGTIPTWLKSGVAAMQKDVETPPRGRAPANYQTILKAMKLELAFFKLETVNLIPQAASELGVQAPDAAAAAGEVVDPETGEPIAGAAKPTTVPNDVKSVLEGMTAADLPPVLKEMSIQEYRRRLVALVRPMFASDWQDRLKTILLDPAPGTFEAAARELVDEAKAVLEEAANKIIVTPNKHADSFAALVRLRFNGKIEGLVAKRSNTELVAKAIQVLDDVTHRFKATGEGPTKNALKQSIDIFRALFSEKSQRVIGTVIRDGLEGDVRRILQLVRQSPSLTPTIVRATEAFVVERFPELLATVVAAPRAREEEVVDRMYTTAEGLQKRRAEYDRLVNVDLEEVRLEIGRALEFGDISENSELDAAREKQRHLAERVERMRTELERALVINPAEVEPDEVRVGTRVHLKNKSNGKTETYAILGPWDADEAHHVISFLAPIGRALLGRRQGEEVDVQLPDGSKARFEILSIERAIAVQATQQVS